VHDGCVGGVGLEERGFAGHVVLAGDGDPVAVGGQCGVSSAAFVCELDVDVAAFDAYGLLRRYYLEQRLLDGDDRYVDEFDGGAVGGLGTFNGDDVTYFESPTVSAVDGVVAFLALLVVGAVDADGARLVLEVPVAVLSVEDCGYGTGYAEGLAVGCCDDVGAGGFGSIE
jgi:hypothetical protein